jgi:hypothetical protein
MPWKIFEPQRNYVIHEGCKLHKELLSLYSSHNSLLDDKFKKNAYNILVGIISRKVSTYET